MFYKEMIFKGVNVFVETDKDGNIIVADGLARMKYQIDDERTYYPKLANLNDAQKDTLQVEQGKTNIGKICKKSNMSNANKEKTAHLMV